MDWVITRQTITNWWFQSCSISIYFSSFLGYRKITTYFSNGFKAALHPKVRWSSMALWRWDTMMIQTATAMGATRPRGLWRIEKHRNPRFGPVWEPGCFCNQQWKKQTGHMSFIWRFGHVFERFVWLYNYSYIYIVWLYMTYIIEHTLWETRVLLIPLF